MICLIEYFTYYAHCFTPRRLFLVDHQRCVEMSRIFALLNSSTQGRGRRHSIHLDQGVGEDREKRGINCNETLSSIECM